MSEIQPVPARPPMFWRLVYSVPVVGRVLREVADGDSDNIWYLLATFVSLWIMAVMIWGLPALYLTALALVPVVFICLMLITVGK